MAPINPPAWARLALLSCSILTLPVVVRADIIPRGYHGVALTTIVRSPPRPGWKLYAEQRWMGGYSPGRFLSAGDDTLRYTSYQALVNLWWIRDADLARIPCDLTIDPCVKAKDDSAFHPIGTLDGNRPIFSKFLAHDSTGFVALTEVFEVRDTSVKLVRVDRSCRLPYPNGKLTIETELRPWQDDPTVSVQPSIVGGFGIHSFQGSKVVVTIPVGVARLKLFGGSGRIRKDIRIAPTGNRPGAVDLGVVPRLGEFLVLEQGGRRSVRFVVSER